MIDVLIVDFQSLGLPDQLQRAKNLLIELLVRHPDTLITVMNARTNQSLATTKQFLKDSQFPHDAIIVSPLTQNEPDIFFKTMFAARIQTNPDQRVVLVIDQDTTAREMWETSGVKFTASPATESSTKL